MTADLLYLLSRDVKKLLKVKKDEQVACSRMNTLDYICQIKVKTPVSICVVSAFSYITQTAILAP